MAKQKDEGDLLAIYFEKERDDLTKFQKIIRKVILSERKNLVVDMTYASAVTRDYLSSLSLGTQALKAHGYTVTFLLSPLNYSLLKSSPDAVHFILEISQVVEENEEMAVAALAEEESPSPFAIDGNTIYIKDEQAGEISESLPRTIQQVLEKGYSDVLVDITELFLLTPTIIQTLILETLNTSNALRIRILESMEEILDANPQAVILNVEKVAGKPKPQEQEDSFQPKVTSSLVQEKSKEKESTPEPAASEEVAEVEEIEETPEEDTPSNFSRQANTLKAGPMSIASFLKDFEMNFQELFDAGEQIYIDLSEFEKWDYRIAFQLIQAHFEALSQDKKLTILLLKDRLAEMEMVLPHFEGVEKKIPTTPQFLIQGSRMEVHNVDMPLFMQKFPENFKTLLNSGYDQLVVDISSLRELSDPAIEMLVLSYMDTMGQGLSFTLRIAAGMEEKFLKSGRGRAMPLEIIRPESQAQLHQKVLKPKIDMSKILDAMGKDRLTEKVIQKQYETVHIESRGTFQNWEPAPIKAEEKKVIYMGVERRVEKRYDSKEGEVIFARGSIGKVGDRRYPLHNVSNSGACFTSPVMLSRNELLRLKIFQGSIFAEVNANVVWSKPIASQALFRVGVQFTKISEVSKMQIKEIVRSVYSSSSE